MSSPAPCVRSCSLHTQPNSRHIAGTIITPFAFFHKGEHLVFRGAPVGRCIWMKIRIQRFFAPCGRRRGGCPPNRRLSEFDCEKAPLTKKAAGGENPFLPRRRRFARFRELRLRPSRDVCRCACTLSRTGREHRVNPRKTEPSQYFEIKIGGRCSNSPAKKPYCLFRAPE